MWHRRGMRHRASRIGRYHFRRGGYLLVLGTRLFDAISSFGRYFPSPGPLEWDGVEELVWRLLATCLLRWNSKDYWGLYVSKTENVGCGRVRDFIAVVVYFWPLKMTWSLWISTTWWGLMERVKPPVLESLRRGPVLMIKSLDSIACCTPG